MFLLSISLVSPFIFEEMYKQMHQTLVLYEECSLSHSSTLFIRNVWSLFRSPWTSIRIRPTVYTVTAAKKIRESIFHLHLSSISSPSSPFDLSIMRHSWCIITSHIVYIDLLNKGLFVLVKWRRRGLERRRSVSSRCRGWRPSTCVPLRRWWFWRGRWSACRPMGWWGWSAEGGGSNGDTPSWRSEGNSRRNHRGASWHQAESPRLS